MGRPGHGSGRLGSHCDLLGNPVAQSQGWCGERCSRMRGPQPTISSLPSKPDLPDKPVVRKCIERIMGKTGLSLPDAKAVLHHMLRTDQQHKQVGPKRGEHRVVAPASSFEEMVRLGEWRRHARPLREAIPQPAATSPTTFPPPTLPNDQPLVTRIPPDRHPAEVTVQLSLRPDGKDGRTHVKAACADGLMLLSTAAFVYAQ